MKYNVGDKVHWAICTSQGIQYHHGFICKGRVSKNGCEVKIKDGSWVHENFLGNTREESLIKIKKYIYDR